MNYHLWIIGCQYNEWDGARLRYFLDSLGLVETDAKGADILIIVACAVRQTAVDRIFGKIRNITPTEKFHRKCTESGKLQSKKLKPYKLVIATGCVLDADKKKFAEKGIEIFEPGDFKTLQKYLGFKPTSYNLNPTTSQYVPIMTGCNNFCSYCAVPYTRGREKSRPMEEIVDDVKKLISAGHKKIMLLGQNVNSYQVNSEERIANSKKKKKDFTELLEILNDLDGDFEISFTSNHPKDMTDDIIEAVANLPKIKKEIHLPLQSGSDGVLQSMNRPYAIKQYLDIVKKIKKAGNIDLTTDVIVGYPTETEEDFKKTVEIFKKVKFKQAYINKYSPRSGTAAFKLGDPISWSEKQRRWRILNDLIKR